MDEMWSFIGKKKQQRWLWHAIDHESGKGLVYVLADPTDAALKSLMQLLMPFGIQQPVELLPRSAYVRKLQHEVVEHYRLKSTSVGAEPERRLRIYPA